MILSEQIKHNINENSNKTQKQEIAYLCYLKILNGTYSKEIDSFEKERYKIFETNDLDKYLICIENFNNNFKLIEHNILKEIYLDLGLSLTEGTNESEAIDLQ